MAELVEIKMTNKSAETIKNADILNAPSTEKIVYDLLVPGDFYNNLAQIFNGGFCDKIIVNFYNTPPGYSPSLLFKSPLKQEPTILMPLPDPYQGRPNYADISVGADLTKDCLLQVENFPPGASIQVSILFDL
jgi:hypothetical protein